MFYAKKIMTSVECGCEWEAALGDSCPTHRMQGKHLRMLILTVGLPRSGKTTWAQRQGLPIVNPDSIRLAMHGQRFQPLAEPLVWATATIMVRSLFLAGHSSVILDATNITRERRAAWRSPDWDLHFVVFRTSFHECKARALALEDHTLVSVIERMARQFETPKPDEARSVTYAPYCEMGFVITPTNESKS